MTRRTPPHVVAQIKAAFRARVVVGVWTKPYRHPRGTKAVQVVRLDGETVHLSDGSSMHWSYVRAVPHDWVAD